MLSIDERALRVVWTVFLFALALTVIFLIRDTLLVFALAIVLAYMLTPLVALVARAMPKRRNVALAVVYCLLIGLMVLVAFLVLPRLVDEAVSLGQKLPQLFSVNKLATIPLPSWLEPVRQRAIVFFDTRASEVGSRVLPILQKAGSSLLSGLGAIFPLILVPILAFFFLKDAEKIRQNLIGSVDGGHQRGVVEQILDDVHLVLKNYIRALVVLSISAFICWTAFLSVMRYPYEVLLAGIAGVLEFIPVVGPAAAAVLIIVVCLATGSGGVLWIALFFAVYRVFADYVLSPYLMSSGVEIHPLLVLFGVLAGDSIAGIPGMFFSVPAMAILRVLYLNLKQGYPQQAIKDGRSQGRVPV